MSLRQSLKGKKTWAQFKEVGGNLDPLRKGEMVTLSPPLPQVWVIKGRTQVGIEEVPSYKILHKGLLLLLSCTSIS